MSKNKILLSILIAGGFVAPMAHATNGYFSHGYGMKSKGMAGVGIALPQDSLAAATNPAGMVMVGDRMDFGVDYFKPVRSSNTSGYFVASGNPPFAMVSNTTGPGTSADFSGNGDSSFLIPEFGYNKMINSNSSFGVSVYGNGGMNTSYGNLNSGTAGPSAYPGCPAPGVFGCGKAGVDLSQLFIAPTYSTMINPDNSLGVSLNLAHQSISVYGIQNFGGISNIPGSVSNTGYDSSNGWGVKLGWIGKITPNISLGATYQSKTKMGKFSKYSGLFAEQGGFDIPETYGVGITAKTSPDLTLAADIQQINYSKVPTLGNSIDKLASCPAAGGGTNIDPACLGGSNGAGFGWRDMTVFKLGASYAYSQSLTLRGGLSSTRQPIPTNESFFNVLAPGVIQNHLTLGATWTLENKGEVTVGYMHGFEDTVNGSNTMIGGKGVNLKMYQDSIGVAYGWKL